LSGINIAPPGHLPRALQGEAERDAAGYAGRIGLEGQCVDTRSTAQQVVAAPNFDEIVSAAAGDRIVAALTSIHIVTTPEPVVSGVPNQRITKIRASDVLDVGQCIDALAGVLRSRDVEIDGN